MRFILPTLVLLATATLAAKVDRPTKTCGERTYVEEKVLGCEVIKSAEVDGDFDTIYDEFNGGIDNENIAAGANIDCGKLLAGSCGDTILGPGSVCTSQIDDGCIVNADINAAADIGGGKLAVGAATGTALSGAGTSGSPSGTTETTIAETPTFTARGTTVFVQGQIPANCAILLLLPINSIGSVQRTLTIRQYSCPGGVCGLPLHTMTYSCSRAIAIPSGVGVTGGSEETTSFPQTMPISFVDVPTAGAGMFYRITAQQSVTTDSSTGGATGTVTWSTGGGYIQQLELR